MRQPLFKINPEDFTKVPVCLVDEGKVVSTNTDSSFLESHPDLSASYDFLTKLYPQLADPKARELHAAGIKNLGEEGVVSDAIYNFDQVVQAHDHYLPDGVNLAAAYRMDGRRSYPHAEQHLRKVITYGKGMLADHIPLDIEETDGPVTKEAVKFCLNAANYNLAEVVLLIDPSRREEALQAIDEAIELSHGISDMLARRYMRKAAILAEIDQTEAQLWWNKAKDVNTKEWAEKEEHFKREYPALKQLI